jgi:uncharacterized repeat protein (TIGR01451 family)
MRPIGRRQRLCAGAVVILAGLLPTLLWANPAGATGVHAAVSPQLSITLDDGQKSATVGDRLGYTITIKNIGTTKASRLVVTQTVPAGLTLESTRPAASRTTGSVKWAVNLAASTTATFRTAGTVSSAPKGLLRLASVACAAQSSTGPAIVCAAHSDQLPAGLAATTANNPTAAGSSSGSGEKWYVIGGSAVVLLGLLGFVVRSRRVKARTP